MHVKHRRAVFLGAVADTENLLEVIAAGILGIEAPTVGGEVLLVDDQRVVLERQALGQLGCVNRGLLDGGQKQRYRAHHKRRGFREQVEVVGERAADCVQLESLGRQLDRLAALALVIGGEKGDRRVTVVALGTDQVVIEGERVVEHDFCGAGVFGRLADGDAVFQLVLRHRGIFEPTGGAVVIHRDRHWQGLHGVLQAVPVKAHHRQVQVFTGDRGLGEIQHIHLQVIDQPVEIHLGVMAGLLALEGFLRVGELFIEGIGPRGLFLHLGQLFFIERHLRGTLVDRA